MTAQISKLKKGFTLIELLVVIGILAILLAVTLIAINPARQFEQANDVQRRSDVNVILNAINQYSIDQSELPGDGLGSPDLITTSDRNISSSEVNICALLRPLYVAALPTDPDSSHVGSSLSPCPGSYDTEYAVRKTPDGRIVVSAPNASTTVEVTR